MYKLAIPGLQCTYLTCEKLDRGTSDVHFHGLKTGLELTVYEKSFCACQLLSWTEVSSIGNKTL